MKQSIILLRVSGLILVAAGMALILTNFASAELSTPLDPIFQVSLRGLFWGMGIVFVCSGTFSVLSDRLFVSAALLFWVSVNFWIYYIGLKWNGTPRFDGVLGTLPETFGMARSTVEWCAYLAFGIIFLASGLTVFAGFFKQRKARALNNSQAIKISCNHCGGHIEYPTVRSGERLPCPHCAKVIVLKSA